MTPETRYEKKARKKARRQSIRNFKIKMATHHAIFVSPVAKDIAKVVNVNEQIIFHWTTSPEWKELSEYWQGTPCGAVKIYISEHEREQCFREKKDLNKTERIWRGMIRRGEDIFPLPEMKQNAPTAFFLSLPVLDVDTLKPINRVKRFIGRCMHRAFSVLLTTLPVAYFGDNSNEK